MLATDGAQVGTRYRVQADVDANQKVSIFGLSIRPLDIVVQDIVYGSWDATEPEMGGVHRHRRQGGGALRE